MARKMITLHEIRISGPTSSKNIGSKKLRINARANKLCKFLKARYGIKTVTHAYKIQPTAAEWISLERMGA